MANPSRGEIYWLDWNLARGSEQAGVRPALVIQNDIANRNDRFPNIVVLTLSRKGRLRPDGTPIATHVPIEPSPVNGLSDLSYVKCEQIMTISKDRLQNLLGRVDDEVLTEIEKALRLHLAL